MVKKGAETRLKWVGGGDVRNESGLLLQQFAIAINFTAWFGVGVLGKDSSPGPNLILLKSSGLAAGESMITE